MPTNYRKIFTEETEEELLNMTREEACLNLNEKQRLFCEHYAAKHNAVLACRKAGYGKGSVHSLSWRLRQNPDVNRYLAWLKLRISHETHVNAMDIIDHYARIAFADVTDFVEIEKGKVTLIDADNIDGQLIKTVKKGKNGEVSLEMYDKLAALQKLERYFDIMPADWKQKIEERKLGIMEKQLELEQIKAGQLGGDAIEDDGFMEALKAFAEEVWEDEDDE